MREVSEGFQSPVTIHGIFPDLDSWDHILDISLSPPPPPSKGTPLILGHIPAARRSGKSFICVSCPSQCNKADLLAASLGAAGSLGTHRMQVWSSFCQLYNYFCSCLMITALKVLSAIYIRQSFFVLLFCWRKFWELGLLFKCPGILGYRCTMICVRGASSLASNLEIILIPSEIELECKSSTY